MQLHISTEMHNYGDLGQNGPDDRAIALVLMTIWATRTGRMLRPVPVSELSAEELVAFWADDQIEDSVSADSDCCESPEHADLGSPK